MVEINGVATEIAVQASHKNGYYDTIAIGGKKQNNVMFYTLYNAGDSELFNLLTSNIDKEINFKISWK